MTLGILPDGKLPHVPGTVLLDDVAAHAEGAAGLKHGRGHIVLNPQPSEDPNDPLNWPHWKKEVITAILCLGAVLHAGTNGPLLNASYFAIAERLRTPITNVVVFSGYNLLAAGASGPLYCALSRRYGKRSCFLVSALFDIIGTAIGQSKISYNHLLAARIIQGFSTSAYESLTISAIGDMYFVHQRGLRVSILNFCLLAASGLASIICGVVFDRLGWLWLFHLFQIALVIQFLLLFFFCPESAYIRDHRYDTDTQEEEKIEELVHMEEEARRTSTYRRDSDKIMEQTISRDVQTVPVPPKKSFFQELAVYTRVYSRDNIFKLIFGPFLTLLNPAACYTIVAAGMVSAFYVGSSIIISLVFSGPPWFYNVSQVAYIGAGPFIGGMVGGFIMSLLSDRAGKFMAVRNSGVYEPEFRLVMMLPAMVIYALGAFLFGYTMHTGAAGPLNAFVWGIMQCGVVIAVSAASAYALDAFRDESNEIFIIAMLFKNFIFYGFSNFINNWAFKSGPAQIMNVFGGLGIFLCLLAVPVYCFGKKLRSWWARHNLFRILKMKTEEAA